MWNWCVCLATGEQTAETEEKKTESSKTPAEESTDKVEEPEEPDSDDEVIEDDVDEWEGDDPNEAEVEPFCLPAEQIVMAGQLSVYCSENKRCVKAVDRGC